MVVWLGEKLVLAIHDRQLAEHGGRSEVRDAGLLQSALARPQQWHACGHPPPDLADLAASLAYGLAGNHPFVEGNKRAAAVCCETFIELNDAMLAAEDSELFVRFRALAAGKLGVDELAAWLRTRIRTSQPGNLQGPQTACKIRKKK